jgi:DNA-binding transcriptional MerR regulator
MEQPITTSEAPPEWEEIRPILDEALESLDEADREALLLRYFKQQSLRAIGLALGVSDDAAQKRISRAIERLRGFFVSRGVVVSASGLAAVISANAVQVAPTGLAIGCLCSATLGVATHATCYTATATKAIAMTTLQKTIVTATIIAITGTGIYERHRASTCRSQAQELQHQHTELANRIQQLMREHDSTIQQLAALRDENESLRGAFATFGKNSPSAAEVSSANELGDNDDPTVSAARSWLARVETLKEQLRQTPSWDIPELQFLTANDWLDATKNVDLATSDDIRKALSQLRSSAKEKFSEMLRDALSQYSRDTAREFPTDLSELMGYFAHPVDDALLQRYEIVPASSLLIEGPVGDWAITERTPVDGQYDDRWSTLSGVSQKVDFRRSIELGLERATLEFAAANNGERPTTYEQLLPFLRTQAERTAIEGMIQRGTGEQTGQ